MIMAKNKFKNFDLLIEEKKKIAPRFQMFGKEYTLAATPRFEAVIALSAMAKRGKDAPVTEEEAFDIFGMIIGEEILAELRAHTDFTMEVASELVNWALTEYGLAEKNEESPKLEADQSV